ncbi:P-loop NTPase, partial [Microbacterium sp. Bi128]|uniref:P-loop NTPase n=1 Tax=Microbacterium sp. Bi128 TaxID=2821115 RepID=UPI001E50380C
AQRGIPFNAPGSLTKVYALASGKGGVGKSSVTVNLACALAAQGLRVGIVDADVYGFSVPALMGITQAPTRVDDMILPPVAYGVKVISIGMFVTGNQPVAWRGPMLHRALEQFLTDVYFGDLDALFLDLLHRWGDEHRKYHGRTHLLAVLEALDLLCDPAVPPRTVLLAAWFHDAVYRGVAGQDEEESARLADDRLRHAGLPAAEVDEVVRLVLLTADHCPEPGDDDGALLSDADLSVLGGEPEAYARYLAAVREDFAHIGDADFAAGRAAVVRQLLQLDPLFHTDRGRTLWLDAARRNLQGELA